MKPQVKDRGKMQPLEVVHLLRCPFAYEALEEIIIAAGVADDQGMNINHLRATLRPQVPKMIDGILG